MKWVGMFSGGLASWLAAKRAADKYGPENGVLLFADVRGEDEDTYRFLPEAAANVKVPLVTIADGRTIWEVFRDERFLGNSRVDPCSRILKRQLLNRWVEENCNTSDTIFIYGFDWSEGHRFERLVSRATDGWKREAPLLERPWVTKEQMMQICLSEGIAPPKLYTLGFQHNNCGGGCVKAGQASFAHLLRTMPERYMEWEENEEKMRVYLGKNISILTDRRGGGKRPLTLREFRERLGRSVEYDTTDYGVCGCFQVAEDE